MKKIDKHVESKKHQLNIGYDFFKKLCEANTKDLSLPLIPIATADQLITNTKSIQSIKPRPEVATNNSEVDSGVGDEPPNDEIDDSGETIPDHHSESEAHASSYDSSDDNFSDDDIDELELQ